MFLTGNQEKRSFCEREKFFRLEQNLLEKNFKMWQHKTKTKPNKRTRFSKDKTFFLELFRNYWYSNQGFGRNSKLVWISYFKLNFMPLKMFVWHKSRTEYFSLIYFSSKNSFGEWIEMVKKPREQWLVSTARSIRKSQAI